jgi:hypothetical protein
MMPLPRSGSIKIGAAPLAVGETRTLIDDAGYQTLLMRVEAGPLGTLHDHDRIEQIYVIEGDFFDDDASYGPGEFCSADARGDAPGRQQTGVHNADHLHAIC